LRFFALSLAGLLAASVPAFADDSPWVDEGAAKSQPGGKNRIAGFAVRGHSSLRARMVGYLAHVKKGDPISPSQIPQLEAAMLSSELFETVKITLEDSPEGTIVVATLDDKWSWVVAPTLYVLGANQAVGVGYVENNLFGLDQKLVLYGQLGNRTSFFFGTYLDPAVAGTPLILRFDVYTLRREIDEYANPHLMPTDTSILRTSTYTFLDAGALVGWTFAWWLVADFRLRGAYVYYRDAHDPAGNPLPIPQSDGWDITAQTRVTLDARRHRYGVTWGPYLQLLAENSVPGLDTYGYGDVLFRAYYSWRLFGEHELELRTNLGAGYSLPLHEDLTLGGETDLRGYQYEQFRGDTRALIRAEYSVPLFRWRWFSFRALGFLDSAYTGFHFTGSRSDRDYLAPEHAGQGWFRNDIGGGIRIYLNNIVLPLLGLDVGYGIEGKSPELYFEVGLTDF
jgi:outer membrane protein insertion porin family